MLCPLASHVGSPWSVRTNTLVLLLHFTAAVKPSPAATDRIPDDLPAVIRVRDPVLEFDKVKGPNCEVSDSCE